MEKYSNKTNKFSIEQVVTLDIDSTGSVTQRLTNLETTLENTLLNALYPGIKVAVVNVPVRASGCHTRNRRSKTQWRTSNSRTLLTNW